MTRNLTSPASSSQLRLIAALLSERDVPTFLRMRARRRDITDGDCRQIIPALQACPPSADWDDARTPEGYDDSPDQGVHQFDGGLGDGSFL